MWPKLSNWIHKHEALLFVLIALIFLRIPSLFEPYWYGDEGIYLTIGQALRHGVELYQGIHDNKPPLLYLIAALSGGTLFWFKFWALISNVLTTIIFSLLASKWWGKTKIYNVCLVIFMLLTTLPFFEGNIANAENFFILFTTLGFYLLFSKNHKYYLAIAGLSLGIASLFKVPAMIEAVIWPFFWLITREAGWFKKSLIFTLSAFTPLIISIIYFASRGILNDYLVAAGLQNIPYLSSWHPILIIGTLKTRATILALVFAIMWLIQKKIDRKLLLLILWFTIALFASLLSGRPYPHYFLQLAAPFALSLGYLFNKHLWPVAVMLILTASVGLKIFNLYPTFGYYTNFLSWIAGQKDKDSYYQWFNPGMKVDYQIAAHIMQSTTPSDRIFVWGDVPVIYALSKRQPLGLYTAKYHILDFHAQTKTMNYFRANPPRFVVVFEDPAGLPGLSAELSQKYLLEKQFDTTTIYRRLPYSRYN